MKKICYSVVLSIFCLAGIIQASEVVTKKLPIVYRDEYNISFWYLDSLHPFDSKKYGKIARYLMTKLGISPKAFHAPEKKITDEELAEVHDPNYLKTLVNSSVIAEIAEMNELSYVPNGLLQWRMLTPMRWAVQGTIDATFLALDKGWAINLSGGYHHAKKGNGEGYCVFADIPLAIKRVHDKYPDHKILIVDLDCHQGNGHEMICGPDKRVSIFDVYNSKIYPCDEEAQKFIDYDFPIEPGIKDPMYEKPVPGISDEKYLKLLKDNLPKAIKETKPDLIIFNAGTDIYKDDVEGRMSITKEGIIERDALVFTLGKENNIPVVMVLSGGYTLESASIISESIENLLTKVVKLSEDLEEYKGSEDGSSFIGGLSKKHLILGGMVLVGGIWVVKNTLS